MRRILLLILAMLHLLVGCEREGAEALPVAPASPTSGPVEPAANTDAPRIVFLGDSLTAGLGVEADQAYPALLGAMLSADGRDAQVVNAGVSGDTTAGGLRRTDWLLRQSPAILVVGLGGNDGLRGLDVETSEQNLRQIVSKAQQAGVKVLLLGMLMPPNYGPEYTARFRAIYPRIAEEMSVALVPFVLEGVGGDARYNQPDGIHPNVEGHRIIARNILPHLRELLGSAEIPSKPPLSENR